MLKKYLTIMLFLFLSIAPDIAHSGVLLDRVVAIVGKDVITWSELYENMEFELADKLRGLTNDEKRRILKKYEKDYLERIIDLRLQLHEARKKNIGVTESELNDAISQIRKKFGLNEDAFKKALKKEGFSYDEYKKKVKEQIIVSKLINSEVRNKIVVTKEEISRYIRNNKNKLSSGEEYRIRQIFFRTTGKEDKASAAKKAEKVMELLNKGEPFDSLAVKYSEGPNAGRGGELGYIKKKDLATPFLEAIDNLEIGHYSKPFRTERGLHIIYLEDKLNPETSRKDRIRAKLVEEKFRKRLKEWTRSLRSREFIEVKL